MNAKHISRTLHVVFGVLVIFLIFLSIDSKPSKPIEKFASLENAKPLPTPSNPESPAVKLETLTNDIPKEIQKPPIVQEMAEQELTVDPNRELIDYVKTLPLPLADLEVKREIERRIKASETERASLIYSESKGGKAIIAYAVKQPSMQEVTEFLKPYKMLLALQTDPASQKYVDDRYGWLMMDFRLTEGSYRLLYAESGGHSLKYYSYAASNEQDARNILEQELAPRPPRVIGVPDSPREGVVSSMVMLTMNEPWRMDQLVPTELIKSYYR